MSDEPRDRNGGAPGEGAPRLVDPESERPDRASRPVDIEPERPAADAEPARDVEQDLDELMTKARQRDEYLSLAQRTQADFENYRKRMAREVAGAEGRGIARLARELLPALDGLQRALDSLEQAGEEQGDGADGHLAQGLRLVGAELAAALARVGIEPYSPHGERFDPNLHEAMAQQPVEGAEPGTVVEVYQPGYRINGDVLRPARVVVAG